MFTDAVRTPTPPLHLAYDDFRQAVAHMPLVSIDLIVENAQGDCLIGLRRNPPARNWWFVPGGRILKNESRDEALERLLLDELGADLSVGALPRFTGVYEHFYDVDFTGAAGTSTHYVVLAYRVRLDGDAGHLPRAQHTDYRWVSPAEINTDATVHPYTKAYFTE